MVTVTIVSVAVSLVQRDPGSLAPTDDTGIGGLSALAEARSRLHRVDQAQARPGLFILPSQSVFRLLLGFRVVVGASGQPTNILVT
jgi:hypothetical protein